MPSATFTSSGLADWKTPAPWDGGMAPRSTAPTPARHAATPRYIQIRIVARRGLERTQIVYERLLVVPRQQIVVVDDRVGFRTAAGVLQDRYVQILGPAVMKEKDALADAPQRSRAEFVAIGASLRHAVRQSGSHFVNGKVAERLDRNVALARQRRFFCREGLGVTRLTADIGKDLGPAGDRSACRGG